MAQNPYEGNINRNIDQSNLNDPSSMGGSQSGGGMGGGGGNVRKSFREASPDEVREMMKDRVAKGIAAFTGVLEGFIERSRSGEVADKTRDALQEAGHTTREAIRGTSEQLDRTRDATKESGIGEKARGIGEKAREAVHKAGDSARRIGGTAREEAKQTREKLGRGNKTQSGGGSDVSTGESVEGVPDLRKSELGSQKDLREHER